MKFGPFVCLPSQLVVAGLDGIDSWERHAKELFNIQKNVPWWLGDFCNYGQARWGDDFWQAVPPDVDVAMLSRFAAVAAKIPPDARVEDVSWLFHSISLRIKQKHLRKAVLQMAKKKDLNPKEFEALVKDHS